jgi:hypothetical protein
VTELVTRHPGEGPDSKGGECSRERDRAGERKRTEAAHGSNL